MEASRDVLRLVEIMRALRNPSGGCPWDLEQDFASIAPYTIEEAYEVADAIERSDPVDLCEELGDLLLQVVYHSQMAAEKGWFDFDDVVEGITRKMIRRHPHVFGDAEARSAGSAKGQWERIKAEEKAEKAARRAEFETSGKPEARSNQTPLYLDDVPGVFPALTLALKIQKRAAKVGFDWNDPTPIEAKIDEELGEFRHAVETGTSREQEAEMGDLLFSVVNLARYHELDPENALRITVRKFRDRFAYIERALVRDGQTLESATLDEMDALWVEAKGASRAASARE
ncbi:MAG: nucleoside triphosphate pyrophosphohydrolase [Fulvimarina manganoxydans]|uniref:nucleoside triphosphate pyrophosphohydrolase n=1 Tax=Fulvimarina manganoxydans TaxID=937218 RepID=UPI002352D85D|nr:nucleoside triphosphate pyrophosphohydrolase [Fulvimarina manganoxydans]MCK5934172.1 nucleoside triphosphate pyrophosphohydrolase [Fulvimarina manganoxydans]